MKKNSKGNKGKKALQPKRREFITTEEPKAPFDVTVTPKIVTKHLSNGQYLTSRHPKKGLFFHHTAGTTWQGAWSWWNQTPARVGTAFIIDRDGLVIECFDPAAWAYHLGVRRDDNLLEMQTIGIELVSAGFVKKEGKEFIFYPLWPNTSIRRPMPKNEILTLKANWRGEKYFHFYTDAQIKAAARLTYYLKKQERFELELKEIDASFAEYDETVWKEAKPGIWSHTTVRKDKWDIYPMPKFIDSINLAVRTL